MGTDTAVQTYRRSSQLESAICWTSFNLDDITAFIGTANSTYDSRSGRLLIRLETWLEVYPGWWVTRYEDPENGAVFGLISASAFKRGWKKVDEGKGEISDERNHQIVEKELV